MGYKKRTNRNTDEITDDIPENVPENVPQSTPEIPDPEPEIDDIETKRKQEIADKRRASLALARSKIIPKSQLKKQVEEATKATQEVIKGKDEVIKIKQEETDAMRLKYERERVKQLEDSLTALQKLIVEKPVPVPVIVEKSSQSDSSVGTKPKYKRPSRAKLAIVERVGIETEGTVRLTRTDKHDVPSRQPQQPQQIIPKKSIEPRITQPTTTETLIDKSYGEQLQERLRTQAINKIMSETFGGF
jgi:hypothetical protein